MVATDSAAMEVIVNLIRSDEFQKTLTMMIWAL